MKKRKPLPPTYFNISIALICATHLIYPLLDFINFPYTLIGILPIVVGTYFNLSADKEFKKYATTVKPFETSSTLLVTGVFKISRNPMYLGMFLILFGISIILGSISPILISVLFALVINRVFIKTEEKMLNDTFGIKWSEYKTKVRRWI